MKLVVVGTGYVGLISGVCFAEFGYQTVCVDKDQNRIDELNQSKCPFYEPGIEDLLNKHLNKTKLLIFSKSCSVDVFSHNSTAIDSIPTLAQVFLFIFT